MMTKRETQHLITVTDELIGLKDTAFYSAIDVDLILQYKDSLLTKVFKSVMRMTPEELLEFLGELKKSK